MSILNMVMGTMCYSLYMYMSFHLRSSDTHFVVISFVVRSGSAAFLRGWSTSLNCCGFHDRPSIPSSWWTPTGAPPPGEWALPWERSMSVILVLKSKTWLFSALMLIFHRTINPFRRCMALWSRALENCAFGRSVLMIALSVNIATSWLVPSTTQLNLAVLP